MSDTWIDISMALSQDMTIWPGHDAPSLTWTRRFEDGFRSISSVLTTNLHNGTHVDAPLHFTPEGSTIDELELDPFIGPAVVVDVTEHEVITADVLSSCVPAETERLLLRTKNSLRRLAGQHEFDTNFVGLSVDAAHWVVEAGIRLVANDFPSIAVYNGDSEIHVALMRAGVGILEGVVLDHVEPGTYELICLPILVQGAEGSLARAVLKSIDPRS